MTRRLLLLLLLSISLNVAVQWKSPHVIAFSSEATRVSAAIQDGRGFSDPYLTGPSGPTAQMPPFYPYLHAAICNVFGVGAIGWLAIVVITSTAWAFQWFFAYALASVFEQSSAGFAAAIIGVLIPLPGRLFKWESVFTGLSIALASWLLAKILTGNARRCIVVSLGITLACGILMAPVLITLLPLWGTLVLLRGNFKNFAALRIVTADLRPGAHSGRSMDGAQLCRVRPYSPGAGRRAGRRGFVGRLRDRAGAGQYRLGMLRNDAPEW